MKVLPSICVFLLLASGMKGFSQRFDYWYFGRKAGLNFSTRGNASPPAILSNSALMADEAAASIADKNGNLLFYTNGVTVFNKQHQVMLNGDQLNGNISSCQVLILPYPGHDSLYYIFTTDAVENDFQTGYRYSIVNMKRDAGKGEVTVKNSLLWTSCTERMAAARHANGSDLWLITNDQSSNIFRSWLINCNGIQANPVVSSVGDIISGYRDINTGVLKVSPGGKLLCQTHFPVFDEISHIPNFAQVFDFDNATGIISNRRKIGFPDAQYTHCEFSPDGQLLYLTRPYEKKMDQLEITLPSTAAILASRVSISTNERYYDLQLAPDEKIYVSRPGLSLAAINSPNVKGTGCNFLEEQVIFPVGSAYIGLPSAINEVVPAPAPLTGYTFTILDSCGGIVQFNGFTNQNTAGTQWNWDFGDGNSSSLQNPVHQFVPLNAVYTVNLSVRTASNCDDIFTSKRIKPGGQVTGNPLFSYTDKCDSGYIRFTNLSSNLSSLSGQVSWDFGDGNTSTQLHPIHTYAAPGIYWVTMRIGAGLSCLAEQIRLPVEVKGFTVKTIPDQVIYVGQSVLLSTTEPAIRFDWTPAQGLSNPQVRNPVATPLEDITYHVAATNAGGCTGEDSVRITVLQYRDIYVPNGFTPNNDGRNDGLRPFFSKAYTLQDFSVFNRWGQRVFTTAARGKSWDGLYEGKPQAAGAYIWNLRLLNESGKKVERKGTTVLIR